MADSGHDPRAFGAKGRGKPKGGPLPGMPEIPGVPEIPGMPGVPGGQKPKGTKPKRPERPAKPSKPRNESLDIAVRKRIKAYPGTMTYLDLIRKNKRESAMLVVCMMLLMVGVGATIGGALTMNIRSSERIGMLGEVSPLVLGLLIGGLLGLAFAAGGTVWAWNAGANAILRMSHAKPLSKDLDPELFNVVEEMAIAGGIPMPKIYVIGDSALNAFATGKDPEHAAVAITSGLRQKLTRDELQGVMAHELAHIRHYDIRFSLLMATMVGIIAVVTDGFLQVTWYGGHMHRRHSRKGEGGAQLALFAIALVLKIVAPLIARIIQMTYSRKREYLADAGAVELSRNPQGLADALRRLAGDSEPLVDTANRGTAHMYIVNPLNRMRKNPHESAGLFSSHPALADRIAKLEALLR